MGPLTDDLGNFCFHMSAQNASGLYGAKVASYNETTGEFEKVTIDIGSLQSGFQGSCSDLLSEAIPALTDYYAPRDTSTESAGECTEMSGAQAMYAYDYPRFQSANSGEETSNVMTLMYMLDELSDGYLMLVNDVADDNTGGVAGVSITVTPASAGENLQLVLADGAEISAGNSNLGCMDSPQWNNSQWVSSLWMDTTGATCATYSANLYCTSSGEVGSGWQPSWGAFSDWADGEGKAATDACCACGGGGPTWPSGSSADACNGYLDSGGAAEYSCYTWDAREGAGSFQWEWPGSSTAGTVLGPLPLHSFCMNLTIHGLQGIDRVELVTEGARSRERMTVASHSGGVVEICTVPCAAYCEMHTTCGDCSSDPSCGWCGNSGCHAIESSGECPSSSTWVDSCSDSVCGSLDASSCVLSPPPSPPSQPPSPYPPPYPPPSPCAPPPSPPHAPYPSPPSPPLDPNTVIDAIVNLRPTAGSTGVQIGTTSDDGNGMHSALFGSFGSKPLVKTVQVEAVIGGNSYTEGDVLTTSNITEVLPDRAKFLYITLRTPVLYEDSYDLRVHYHLRDAIGQAQVAHEGLVLQAQITCAVREQKTRPWECALPDSTSGAGECAMPEEASSVVLSWLDTTSDVLLNFALTLMYDSEAVAVSTSAVTLSQQVVHGASSAPRLYLDLPFSPRYVGDTVVAELYADTGSHYLSTWNVLLTYDNRIFRYESFVWNPVYNMPLERVDNSTVSRKLLQTSSFSELSFSVVGTKNKTVDTEISGNRVYLMSIFFTALQSNSLNEHVITATCVEFVNTATYIFLFNQTAQVRDARSGVHILEGVQQILSVESIAVFAYVESAELFNFGGVNPDLSASTMVNVLALYNSPTAEAAAVSGVCSSEGRTVVSVESSCMVTVSSNQTEGAAAVVLDVTYAGFTEQLPMRVWYPQTLTVQMNQSTLAPIQSPDGVQLQDRGRDCGSLLYEEVPATVMSSFGGSGLDSTRDMDMTSYTTLELSTQTRYSTHAVAIDGSRVRGLQPGVEYIRVRGAASVVSMVQAKVTVVEEAITVTQLEAVVVTGGTWGPAPATVGQYNSTLHQQVSAMQALSAEGASGNVYVAMHLTDGTRMMLREVDGISVRSSQPANLEVTSATSAHADFRAVVPDGGNDMSDNLTVTWTDCFDEDVMIGTAPVKTILKSPVSATLTSTETHIARASDAAAQSPVSLSTSALLTVSIHYDDGTSRDFTTDSRTVYTVVSGSLAYVEGNTVMPREDVLLGTSGSVTVEVSFPDYSDATSLTASVVVHVVSVQSLDMTLHSYPRGNGTGEVSHFILVLGTSVMQRGIASLVVRLTDGSSVSVTDEVTYSVSDPAVASMTDEYLYPLMAGTTVLNALWQEITSNEVTVTVDTGASVRMLTVEASTSWSSGRTFLAPVDGHLKLNASVTFEDNSTFPDFRDVTWLLPNETLTWSSSEPSIISVGADGEAVLRGNHYLPITITTSSQYADLYTDEVPSCEEDVYANLEPEEGHVDVGERFGLQFPPRWTGEMLAVNVRIRAEESGLLAFQVAMFYVMEHLKPTSCYAGADWNYGWHCAYHHPEVGLMLAGTTTSDEVRGAALDIGTAQFEVGSEAVVSYIVTKVIAIQLSDQSKISSEISLVGSGYVQLNGGTEVVQAPYQLERQAYGECGSVFGDADEDCIFDVCDVLFVQLISTKHPGWENFPGYTGSLDNFSDWQRKQMDPTLDYLREEYVCPLDDSWEAPCPTFADSQYLLNVIAGNHFFLDVNSSSQVVTAPAQPSGNLTLQVLLRAAHGNIVTNGAGVHFEVYTVENMDMELVFGEALHAEDDRVLVESAISGDTYTAVTTDPSSAFSSEQNVSVVVVVTSYNSSGGALVSYAFYGTDTVRGCDVFDPFTTFDFPLPPPPCPSPPPAPLPPLPLPPPPQEWYCIGAGFCRDDVGRYGNYYALDQVMSSTEVGSVLSTDFVSNVALGESEYAQSGHYTMLHFDGDYVEMSVNVSVHCDANPMNHSLTIRYSYPGAACRSFKYWVNGLYYGKLDFCGPGYDSFISMDVWDVALVDGTNVIRLEAQYDPDDGDDDDENGAPLYLDLVNVYTRNAEQCAEYCEMESSCIGFSFAWNYCEVYVTADCADISLPYGFSG
eukprot:gene8861-10501_t